MSSSKGAMAKVLAQLDEEIGRTPKQVYCLVGTMALISVRHALRDLCDDGTARYTGPDSHRLYFKAKLEQRV